MVDEHERRTERGAGLVDRHGRDRHGGRQRDARAGDLSLLCLVCARRHVQRQRHGARHVVLRERRLHKIGCFCFEKQTLKPNEKQEFVLTFFLDPKVVDDNKTKNISDVTLSFTFFASDFYEKSKI